MHHRRRKSIFDDDVRLAKAGLEIALAPSDVDKVVGRLLQGFGQSLVVHDIGMNEFRAGLESFHGIEQRLGFFVLDFDQIHRLFGDQLVSAATAATFSPMNRTSPSARIGMS